MPTLIIVVSFKMYKKPYGRGCNFSSLANSSSPCANRAKKSRPALQRAADFAAAAN
jgi:hypothetical protein